MIIFITKKIIKIITNHSLFCLKNNYYFINNNNNYKKMEVEAILENDIDDYEDLLNRKLFSLEEVNEVSKKRRDYETKLRRFQVLKEDYLRAIEFELQLNKLLVKRKERLNAKEAGSADFAMVKKVSFLFDRALKKFKSDLDLFTAAIDFGKQNKCSSQLSQWLASAIRHHPTHEEFWILAGKFIYTFFFFFQN